MEGVPLDKRLLIFLSEVGTGSFRDLSQFFKDNLPEPTSETERYALLRVLHEFLTTLENSS